MGERLSGQVAVITGAGGHIGQAEALALADEGARIVVNDVKGAQATVDEIRDAGGEAVAETSSASSWAAGRKIVQAALDHFGRIDILINNAGTVRPGPIQDMAEDEWDAVIDVHLKGYAGTINAAAPHFIAQGSGVIVNTGSTSGLGHIRMANYSAAKEGVLGLTRAVARDLGQFGVRCNLVRPLTTVSGMASEEVLKTMGESSALGFPANGVRHMAFSQDRANPLGHHVAALVTLLCLPLAAEISGQDFYIMGDEVGRFPEPRPEYLQFNSGGWTLEALEAPDVLDNLIGDVRNRYVKLK